MNKSIYEKICENIENGVLRDDFYLPNDDADRSPVYFAPGAFDGVCMYHMGFSPLDAEAYRRMAQAIRTAAAGDVPEADKKFHAWTKDHQTVSYIDDLQHYVVEHAAKLDAGRLHHAALSMLLKSSYIECVKVGLALLEMFGEPDDKLKEMIRRIGLYDEFTIFSVWNMRGWENGNEEIFALARKTHGWGRIHAAECLEPETEEIRYWLLTEGVKNNVMYAYSALPCWQKSDAERILFRKPTQEEYEAIAILIESLLDEGPVSGISELDHAEKILLRFLALSPEYNLTADDYNVIFSVKEWADDEEHPYPSVAEAAYEILHSAACTAAVENAVKEGRELPVAEALGISLKNGGSKRCVKEKLS